MKAAMWDKNVWILNASSEEVRVFLLGAGFINIDGTMVRLYGDHPFINLDKDGNRIPSTKLIIDGLPIDLDGDVITRHLTSLGIQTRSKLKFENAWDPLVQAQASARTCNLQLYHAFIQTLLKQKGIRISILHIRFCWCNSTSNWK